MRTATPALLRENDALAYVGEVVWAPARLTPRATKLVEADHNPTGRPNSDVMRHVVGVKAGRIETQVQIDFPAHFTEQEAGLYLKPFQLLQTKTARDSRVSWWQNPHANPDLRNAIARIDRYLATPTDAELPAWDWIESERLPAENLVIIARDDDFIHGIVQSRFFAAWWTRWSQRLAPVEIVQSFSFPWPPATLLSALTRAQEEHRLAIARAARAGAQEQLNSAVAAALGISRDTNDSEVVLHLHQLNRQLTTAQAGR